MSIDIRKPMITGASEKEQLNQIRSYLYQLSDTLNYALKDTVAQAEMAVVAIKSGSSKTAAEKEAEAVDTFTQIKDYIIKSADIVNAYSEIIETKLNSVYAAKSEYNSYVQETNATLRATSDSLTQYLSRIETLEGDMNSVRQTSGYIRSGALGTSEQGDTIYGLEIGQKNLVDGIETFNKWARFTADKLSFYDNNGTEVAYFSDRKLHVSRTEILNTMRFGGYELSTENGIRITWKGSGNS